MKQVILYNIRSAHNVGSIFRTSDGAGVEKVWLLGYTPAPVDRFGRTVDEIKKTSLGASESVVWEQVEWTHAEEMEVVERFEDGGVCTQVREKTEGLLTHLRQNGYTIVAVEQHPTSVDLYDFSLAEKTAYIFGNEVDGVPNWLCEQVDVVVEIPMAGMKESLNVSVTAGITLFHKK